MTVAEVGALQVRRLGDVDGEGDPVGAEGDREEERRVGGRRRRRTRSRRRPAAEPGPAAGCARPRSPCRPGPRSAVRAATPRPSASAERRPPPLAAAAAHRRQDECGGDQDQRHQRVAVARRLGDHVAGLTDQEGDRGLAEAFGSGLSSIQPMWVGLACERRAAAAPARPRRPRRPPAAPRPPARAQRHQQPDRLDRDREDGEVVAAERQRRGQGPEARSCPRRVSQRPHEEEQRDAPKKTSSA